jgi:type 1 glutamine amidotransferase
VLAGVCHAQRKNPEGAPVLILSGGQREHHGYRAQSLYLAKLLEDTGRVRATISEDAAIVETPKFAKYKAILVIADRRDEETKLTPAQQEAILAFVRGGRGYVSIHGGDNAPADWLPEMKTMLGGIYSHTGLPDGRAIGGRTWNVKIADSSHPITRGLGDFSLQDELYINLQMRDGVKPLATIDFEGKTWPVAWTTRYGAGAVFHTTLGHTRWEPGGKDPLEDPYLSRLVLQAVDWVLAESANPAPRDGG